MTPYPPPYDGADLTPPAPTLVDQLADVLAESVDLLGTEAWDGHAEGVLAWLKEHGWLRPPERQQIFAELASLRALLGLQPGEQLCGAENQGLRPDVDPPHVCLLPAGHRRQGHWHRGVGGSWSL